MTSLANDPAQGVQPASGNGRPKPPVPIVPEVGLELGGSHLPTRLLRRLTYARVSQQASLPTQCEVELDLSGASDLADALANARPGQGLCLHVQGAAGRGQALLFKGDLTAIELLECGGGRRIRLRGYDPLHRLAQRQPVRVHVEMTVAHLARELVSDLAIQVDADDDGPRFGRIFQCGRDDLALLRHWARRIGRWFHLDSRQRLRLFGAGGDGLERIEVPRAQIIELRAEHNARFAGGRVRAIGWQVGSARAFEVDEAVETGKALGDAAAEERVWLNVPADTEPQLRASLGSHAGELAAGTGVVALLEGDPELAPGRVLELTEIGLGFDRSYTVMSAVHRIDPFRGYVTEVSTQPPAEPVEAAHEPSLAATFGVVTRVDDPQEHGRVCVVLPALGNLETDWLAVMAAGAGAGKGLITLPDVEDRVLVLLPEGDPAHGIVVGGLYGDTGPPDHGVDQGAIRRFTLLTPGGQRVGLDDAGRRLRLENSEGSYLEIAPEQVILHAETALQIEAPGQAVVVVAGSVDFKRG